MKPGRELDVLVGRRVMNHQGLGVLVPAYSTDHTAAARLLHHVGMRYGVRMEMGPGSNVMVVTVGGFTTPMEDAVDFPHALCLASLQAVSQEET